MTQYHAKQMRPLAFALLEDPCPLAKIHLHFLPRLDFDAPEGQRLGRLQSLHKPLHRMVTAAKLALDD